MMDFLANKPIHSQRSTQLAPDHAPIMMNLKASNPTLSQRLSRTAPDLAPTTGSRRAITQLCWAEWVTTSMRAIRKPFKLQVPGRKDDDNAPAPTKTTVQLPPTSIKLMAALSKTPPPVPSTSIVVS